MSLHNKKKTFFRGVILALVVYLILKLLMVFNVITPFYVMIIQKICIDIILAVGLNLITGYTGQFSLGHAGFMAVGAYTAALIIEAMPLSLGSIVIACVMATFAGGLAGFLIGIPTLRLKGDYLAIATLGFAEIIRIVIQNVDQSILGGAAGLSGLPRFSVFGGVFLGAIFAYFIINSFIKSSYGRAAISIREDEVAAEAMGVNLTKTKMTAFVIGTALAGFAGALYVGNIGYIAPKDFGFMKSIDILLIVVIGGLGNLPGTVVAAVLLNILTMFLQNFAEVRMIIYALILIMIMLFKSGETPFFVNLREKFSKYFDTKKWLNSIKGKKKNKEKKLD